jgi:hypothetical protein
VIEWLHPLAIGVVVACMPVATVAVSAGIDYRARRQQAHRPLNQPANPSDALAERRAQSGAVKALSGSSLPTAARKP